MGKNKKKFIDRKNAITFHLVHRSQHDPLIVDENAPQHVLVEAKTKSSELDPKKRKQEQHKFGVFFDDDYDYLQHLKEKSKNDVVWEYVETPNNRKKSKEINSDKTHKNEIQLPSSVFASEFEEDIGMLNKAAPHPGPKPDWDPDVVAALDDDFDFDNPNNQLEDDFVLKAMEEDDDSDGNDDIEFDENDEKDIDSDGLMYSDEDYEDNELNDRLGPLLSKNNGNFDDCETKSRFTEYSLTSSVIRRNEQLKLLDERFEKFFEQYDDPEIGPLDMEDIEGTIEQKHPMLLHCYRLYKRSNEYEKYNKEWDKERLKKYEYLTNESDKDEFIEMEVKNEKEKKWDCESILSLNSNIYNHPKLIEEPLSLKKHGKIQIDPKTGIPMNVLKGNSNGTEKLTLKSLAKLNLENDLNNDKDNEGRIISNGPKSLCAKSVISTLSVLSIRPKDESPEEKKERKKLLKEYRAERRIEKKANSEAFKEEKKRQQKIKINNQINIQGKKIL